MSSFSSGRSVILSCVIVIMAACTPPAQAPADPGGCTTDPDCDGDLVCNDGSCVPQLPGSCREDDDCAGSCEAGRCVDANADAVVAPAAVPRDRTEDRARQCRRFVTAADHSQAVFVEIAAVLDDPDALRGLLDEVTTRARAVAEVPLSDAALVRFRERWVLGLKRLRDQVSIFASTTEDPDAPAPALGAAGDALEVLVREVNAYCADTDGNAPDAGEHAPATFSVRFETTAGPVVVSCTRAWAPHGVDHFHDLVEEGFYTDVAIFRAVKGFVTQFGIHGDPAVAARQREVRIPPDPVVESNLRGMLTYAQAGQPAGPGLTADSRSSQLFFNLGDNVRLDGMGFAPICVVVDGMDAVDRFFTGYGEKAGRDQGNIQTKGNAYLRATYPELDFIERATIIPWVEPGPTPD